MNRGETPEPRLPEYEIPDLTLQEGEYWHTEVIEFPLDVEDRKLAGRLEFTKEGDPDTPYKAKINLQADEGQDLVLNFKANVNDFSKTPTATFPREKIKHLQIYYRRIEPQLRRKGLGDWAIRLLEDAAVKFGQKYPELKPEEVHLNSTLTSTTRMIIDQSWLKQNGLERFARESGRNLGYTPIPEQAHLVGQTLIAGTEELEQVKHFQQIMFVKKLE